LQGWADMSTIKQWIVYITPNNKTQAIEDTHSGLQCDDLTAEHNVIVGFVNFKNKQDAIAYGEQVLCPS